MTFLDIKPWYSEALHLVYFFYTLPPLLYCWMCDFGGEEHEDCEEYWILFLPTLIYLY